MDGDISIGAVGAALIAGVVSLLGLIISKEQKTSEFRQAWVDALRSEITAYLTNFNAIADAINVTYKDQAEKVKALSPLYSKLNEASFAITLRVNPNEDRSRAVLACMKQFMQLASNDNNMIPTNIRPIEIHFLNASKELLKYEWKRVKRGEITFIVTKFIAGTVIIAALLYWLMYSDPKSVKSRKTDAQGSVINNFTNELYQVATPEIRCVRPPTQHSSGPFTHRGTSDRIQRRRPYISGHAQSKGRIDRTC